MTDLFEENITINFRISNKPDIIRKIKCNSNSQIKRTLDDYIKKNNINLKKYYVYYNQAEIDITKRFNEYGIKGGDNLITSNNKLIFKEYYNDTLFSKSCDNIVTTEENNNPSSIIEQKSRCNKCTIIIIITSIIIVVAIIILLFLFLYKKKEDDQAPNPITDNINENKSDIPTFDSNSTISTLISSSIPIISSTINKPTTLNSSIPNIMPSTINKQPSSIYISSTLFSLPKSSIVSIPSSILNTINDIPSVPKENLVVDLDYKLNKTMFFTQTKINNSTQIINGNQYNNITQTFTNFSVTIKDEFLEDNKKVYSAYLVILNMTNINDNSSELVANFDIFNNYTNLEMENLRNLNETEESNGDNNYKEEIIDLSEKNFEDLNFSEISEIYLDKFNCSNESNSDCDDLINSIKTFPIVNFIFFKNGEIKDIFLPKHLKSNIFFNIYDLIEKIIPKISNDLYDANNEKLWDFKKDEQIAIYRDIEDFSEDKKIINLLEVEKSAVYMGDSSNEIKFEGSNLNSYITREYNTESQTIKNINSKGKISLVNDLSNEKENYNELLEDYTQSNIIENGIKSITLEVETNIEFNKNITDLNIVDYLDDIFNKMEIIKYNESEYGNNTLRILNSLSNNNNVTIVKRDQNKIWSNVKLYNNKKAAYKELETLRKLSSEAILEFSYAYNIFKTNIFGLKLQLQAVEKFNIKEGKLEIQIILTIGCFDISFPLTCFDSNINLIMKNSQSMTEKLINLLNETNIINKNLSREYANKIIEYEENITNLIKNPFDFYNLYSKSLNNLYYSAENLTVDTLNDFIDLINICHDNYTILLNRVKNGEEISINEIREIIINEYIVFINKMVDSLELFFNSSLIFLEDIKGLISDNFQIDILYDIEDNIITTNKIFIKFVNLLFNSIQNGMEEFNYNLKNYIASILGDLLENSQFIANSLNENEIIRKTIPIEKQEDILAKLKNFKNIVNELVNYLYNKINDDYIIFIENENETNIKRKIRDKVQNFEIEFNTESNSLLKEIKRLINNIENYELYVYHLDKIHNIGNNITGSMVQSIYENIMKVSNNNKLNFIFSRDLLKNKTIEIIDFINDDIKKINNFIQDYIFDYKRKNKYKLLSNMSKINKYFMMSEMKNLINEYYYLIIDSVNIKISETLNYNYNIGISYLQDVYNYLFAKRFKDAKGVTYRFLSITSDFASNNANLLSQILSEFPNIAKKHFIQIRKDILNYFEHKLSKIEKFNLNNSIYYDFIDLFNEEINSIKDNIKDYFNEEIFDKELLIDINNYTNEKAINLNDEKSKKYNDLYNKIMDLNDYPKAEDADCYHMWIVKIGFIRAHRTMTSSSNHYQEMKNTIKNLDIVDDFLENKRILFIQNFTNKFDEYLNNYINITKKLYEDLNIYINDILNNNTILLKLIKEYTMIINNDINKNKHLLLNSSDEIIYKLNQYFNNIINNFNDINDDYINNFYYKDKNNFVEYPKEIKMKMNIIKEEFISISNILKNKMLYYYKNKTKINFELIKNTTYFYLKNDLNSIFSESYNNKIFDDYLNIKLILINESFNDIQSNITLYDYENYSDILNIEYENNNSLLINNLTTIINNLESIIEDDFSNLTFGLNYSKYNFNIIKLRKSINYTKNLIDSFENMNIDPQINEKYLINKLNDITDFNIYNIYNKSLEKLNILNKRSFDELDYYLTNFKNQMIPYIINKIDYTNNINNLKEILNNTLVINEIYQKQIENKIDNIINRINDILDKELTDLRIKGNYNFNFTEYQNYFELILSDIIKSFDFLANDTYKIGYDYIFTNSFLDEIDILYKEKNIYFNNLIKSLESFYQINFFNFTLDLGNYIEKYMIDIHEKNFNFTYEYVDILEKFLNRKNTEVFEKINDLKISTIHSIKNIFDNYTLSLNMTKCDYINEKYIEELNLNRTECSNYTLEHLNDEDQIIYLNYDNNCILLNETNNNETDNKNICPFLNKTKYIYYCNENNYFNKNEYFYENLTIKNEIENLTNNLIKTIEFDLNSYTLSECLYNNTINLYKNNLSLYNYNITFSDTFLQYELTDFEIISDYLLNNDKNEYINYIREELITEFNNSIIEYINNIIYQDIELDIKTNVQDILSIKFDILENSLQNEFYYYLNLLNNTEQIGITTKEVFLNLYDDFYRELIKIINHIIDDYFFDFDIFHKKNSKIFIDEFYIYLKNNISNKIFDLHDNIDIFRENQEFTSSLEKIIQKNVYDNIFEKIKNNITDTIKLRMNLINQTIISFNDVLFTHIDTIQVIQNPDMIPIINRTKEYNDNVKQQNYSFFFKVSNKAYNLFYNYTREKLEPDLIEIKNKYDEIQNEMLIQIYKKVDENPDYYPLIIEKYQTDNIKVLIENYTQNIENLMNDFSTIIINNSDYKRNFEDLKKLYETKRYLRYKRKLSQFGKVYPNNFKIKKNSKNIMDNNINNNKRRKLSNIFYGYLCFNDVTKELLKINETINNFYELFNNNELNYLNNTLINTNKKIDIYTNNLQNQIDNIILKMSNIFTKEKLKELNNRISKDTNLIKLYVQNHTKIITFQLNIFNNIVNNKSKLILEETQLNITENIEKLYDELLEYILSIFEDKSFKITEQDFYSPNEIKEIDLANLKFPEYSGVSNFIKLSGIEANFDAEDYINTDKLEKFLNSIDKYMSNEDATLWEREIPVPLFGIPFILRFKIEYGFEFGVTISTNNHNLISHLYAEVHSCASATGGINLGIMEFGGGLRGLLGYGKAGIKINFNLKYLTSVVEYYYKLATARFQVFAYFEIPFPKIYWIKVRFLFVTVRIPFIKYEPKRFEVGSKWTNGLQKNYLSKKDY